MHKNISCDYLRLYIVQRDLYLKINSALYYNYNLGSAKMNLYDGVIFSTESKFSKKSEKPNCFQLAKAQKEYL